MRAIEAIGNFFASAGGFASFFTLLIAAAGCWLAVVQWRESNKYKRAEIMSSLLKSMRDDSEIAYVLSLIDMQEGFKYCDGRFELNPSEKMRLDIDNRKFFAMVDKTLAHLSYICFLHANGTIKDCDMRPFEYSLKRTASNHQIATYLYNLYHWSKSQTTNTSFIDLIEYAVKEGVLESSFYEIANTRYIQQLPF